MSLMLLLALGVRLYDIHKPFVGLLPVREFRSAIIARDIYYSLNPDVPAWQREVTDASRAREWSLEPPIMEWLAAYTYELVGGEHLWIPRLYATLFWSISGVLFARVARSFFDHRVTIALTAYYLFDPLGVIASKSFQPDTLMMMFYLASLWAILRYDRTPTKGHLIWAMSLAFVTVLIRPLSIFAIFAGYTALTAYRFVHGQRRSLAHHIGFCAALALGATHYGYGLAYSGALAGQAEITFLPHLLLVPEFWKNWIYTGLDAITVVGAITALLGLALLQTPRLQWLLFGLWASYFVYGIIFTYHISTHNYYHLQLIPTIALSAGPLLSLLLTRTQGQIRTRWQTAYINGVMVMLILLASWQVVQHGRRQPNIEAQAVAQEIGKLVNHSTETAYLSPYYGRALEYYGELSGAYWPRPDSYGMYNPSGARNRSIADRLAELGFMPDYFVITDLAEYQRHHTDLREYLMQNCDLLAQHERYIIYRDCRWPTPS